MNLEFDADESAVINAFRDVVRAAYPVPRPSAAVERGADERTPWQALVAADWWDIAALLESSALDLGTAIALYREAGRVLATEELVTNGFLLPALAARVESGDERDDLVRRLRAEPGSLVVRSPGKSAGDLAFGAGRNGYELILPETSAPAQLRITRADPTGLAGLSTGVSRWSDDAAPTMIPLGLKIEEWQQLEQTAMLLHSAALLGCAGAAVEQARDYALTRRQFDTEIGRFQAVKHLLADAFTGVEVAWNAALYAAAAGETVRQAVLCARLLGVDAALVAVKAAAQVYGGVGYTAECALQFYLKAVLDGVLRFGAPDDIAAAIGADLVAGQGSGATNPGEQC